MPNRQKYSTTNREFTQNEMFRVACDLASVPPTRRQASKWRNQRGQAYAKRHEAAAVLTKKGESSNG